MTGQRHVLVIAYSFPPHGAIGTMRTLRVVRQLHSQGWRVTVLTGSPSHYLPQTPVDAALLDRVPEGVRVLRAGAWHAWSRWTDAAIAAFRGNRKAPAVESAAAGGAVPETTAPHTGIEGGLRTVRNTIDALLSIPDGESGWFVPAVVKGLAASFGRGRPDVVYSSSPAWTGQLVAYAIAGTLRRPWVADFRDPWARAPWREGRLPIATRAANLFEGKVVRRANCILFAARGNREEFARHYGDALAARFHFVSNGCDPAEFELLEGPAASGPFVLLHAGSLYGGRSPLPVLEAAARAIREGLVNPATFRIRFLGSTGVHGLDVRRACRGLGLDGVVELGAPVPRAASLAAMASASALLLLQPGHTVSVPGKLFEYLATGRPILALAEEGEISEIVRASGVGVAVVPGDERGLTEALGRVVAMAASPLPRPPRSMFDGTVNAAHAVEILDAVAAGRDARAPYAARRQEGVEEALLKRQVRERLP